MSATKEHFHNEIEAGQRSSSPLAKGGGAASDGGFGSLSTNPPSIPPFSKGDEKRKEKPILFSSAMVRAILEGRKTQTRRVIKPQPYGFVGSIPYKTTNKKPTKNGTVWVEENGSKYEPINCPYGELFRRGDLLWVRETTAFTKGKFQPYDTISYKADDFHKDIKWAGAYIPKEELCTEGWHCENFSKELKWKPSIHMKKEYARIWSEITEIKVERLQDISEDDAIAEGIKKPIPHWKTKEPIFEDYTYYTKNPLTQNRCFNNAKDSFKSLWYSINGNKSWRKNPWVWVVKFRVLSTTGKPQECYKTGDICKYDCKGLCRESM